MGRELALAAILMAIVASPAGAGEATYERVCQRQCSGNSCTTTCRSTYTPPLRRGQVQYGRGDGLLSGQSGGGVAIWNTR